MRELIASLLVLTAGCTVHVHEDVGSYEYVRVRHVRYVHSVDHHVPAHRHVTRYPYAPRSRCTNLNPNVCKHRGY